MMKGWRRLWNLGCLLAMVGCTSPAGTTPAEDSSSREPATSPPDPEAGPTVPETGTPPPGDTGRPSGDVPLEPSLICTPSSTQNVRIPETLDGEDPPSLAPSACVRCNQTLFPREDLACEKISITPQTKERSRFDTNGIPRESWLWDANGVLVSHHQYDADGHPLGLSAWNPDGALAAVWTYGWADGLQVHFKQEGSIVGGGWRAQDWTYDARRRIVARTDTDSHGTNLNHQFIYQDDRLVRVEHRSGDSVFDTTDYSYDTLGRLVRAHTWEGCDSDLSLCESREYDAAGHLLSATRQLSTDEFVTTTYDALGRPLTRSQDIPLWSEGSSNQWAYDAQGHLILESSREYGGWGQSSSSTHSLYDPAGNVLLRWGVNRDSPIASNEPRVARSTTRTTYLCDTARIDMTETDGDGDGVVDARCTYERDTQGRLLRVHCAPLSDPSAFTSRTEYHYDCTP